jgi:protein TonB
MTSERTQDWVDEIVQRLIRHAARRAPGSLAERLEEEWLADSIERIGRLARLRFALGCCWAMNTIAREHAAVAALPAGAANGPQRLFALGPETDSPFFTGRPVAFVLVVSLHLAVLYGLAMGLGPKFTRMIVQPFVVQEIPQAVHRDPQPLPVPHIGRDRVINVPRPEWPPIAAEPKEPIVATPGEPPTTELARPPEPKPASRVEGGPGLGFPDTRDFYPDRAIRLEEQGVATVRACVDARGYLESPPTLVQSTGSASLDQAALKLAKAGSGHYRASTEDGKAVDSCYPFRIRFELRK